MMIKLNHQRFNKTKKKFIILQIMKKIRKYQSRIIKKIVKGLLYGHTPL